MSLIPISSIVQITSCQERSARGVCEVVERPLDRKSSPSVNTELDADKSERRSRLDVVIRTELFDPVNNEFLNQVGAVGDAGDEGGAGNCNSTERESWTDCANKDRGHPDGDEWELPDTRRRR